MKNDMIEKYLVWGLVAIILALPTYMVRFSFGLPTNLLEVLIYVLTLVGLVAFRVDLKEMGKEIWGKLNSWKWPIGLFLLSAIVSVFVSSDKRAGLGLFKAYFIDPLLIFAAVILLKEKKSYGLIFGAFGVSVIWMVVLAKWQYFLGGYIPGFLASPEPWISQTPKRVASVFEYPNALGLYLAPIAAAAAAVGIKSLDFARDKNHESPLHMSFAGQARIKNKGDQVRKVLWFSAIVFLAGLVGIILANSRGALIGLLAGILLAGMVSKYWKWVLGGFAVLLIIGLLATPLPQKIEKIMNRKDISADTRIILWQNTGHLIRDHWFLGTGLGGFQAEFDKNYRPHRYKEELLYPHDIVLNFWVELGLMGLIAFSWLIWRYMVQGTKIIRNKVNGHDDQKLLAVALVVAMTAILVHGLVDVPFFKNDLAIVWWMLMGMMINVSNNLKLKDKS